MGEEYQAIVPPAPPSVNTQTDSHLGAEANLLWFPGRLSESETERYELAYAQVISLVAPNAATPDDEEVRFLAFWCIGSWALDFELRTSRILIGMLGYHCHYYFQCLLLFLRISWF